MPFLLFTFLAVALVVTLVGLFLSSKNRAGDEPAVYHPGVTQLIWPELLAFIWNRWRTYRNQKTQVRLLRFPWDFPIDLLNVQRHWCPRQIVLAKRRGLRLRLCAR